MLYLLKQQDAILTFDKPKGWTSFDAVRKLKYKLSRIHSKKKFKVGHAGTLDPLASGVLVICTGKCTKQIEGIQGLPKEYITTMKFGESTPSYDLETAVDKTAPFNHITKEALIAKIQEQFLGEIDQVPPAHSALKVNGKRAYSLARSGETVTLAARKVVIYNIEITNFALPYCTLKVNCGKGTYIRSLVHDLGKSLGSLAYIHELQRTAIGEFTLDKALSVEDIDNIRLEQ